MLAAVARLTTGVVVATMDTPALPAVAPDNTEYLPLSPGIYNDLKDDLFNDNRSLRWRLVDDGAGSFLMVENLADKFFYAICNTGDRAIVALDTAIPDFTRPGLEVVEISQADFLAINAGGQWHDAGGLVANRNCAVDGTVTARPDTRPVLRVTAPGPHEAGVVTINFALEDSAGVPMPVTGSRDIIIRQADTERRVRVELTNGVETKTPTLTGGRYDLTSADLIDYRMTGDTILEVAEAWA